MAVRTVSDELNLRLQNTVVNQLEKVNQQIIDDSGSLKH